MGSNPIHAGGINSVGRVYLLQRYCQEFKSPMFQEDMLKLVAKFVLGTIVN